MSQDHQYPTPDHAGILFIDLVEIDVCISHSLIGSDQCELGI
jgi:hypothetical protein